MKRVTISDLHLWQFEGLGNESNLRHFVTDRNTYEEEFTLSLSSLPDKERIHTNRNMLAGALSIPASHLFFPSQVHETRIVEVTKHTTREELHNTDALITTTKGICIAVMSADCVPILVYDKKNSVIAAVHSGWRGTVAKILEKTLHHMRTSFGSKGENIIAGIGPSAGQEEYEVGEEVIEAVHHTFGKECNLMIHQENKKARLDLWTANKIQLLEFGVPETAIEIASLCTITHNHHFFSARKGDTGRFAAGIMMMDT